MQNAISQAGLRHYFFTKKELAQLLRLSTKSIDRLISAGKLKPIRLTDRAIRIYGKDVEHFLKSGGVSNAN